MTNNGDCCCTFILPQTVSNKVRKLKKSLRLDTRRESHGLQFSTTSRDHETCQLIDWELFHKSAFF